MKNLKYIMATLMVALAVAVVFVGCKKDKDEPDGNPAPTETRKPIAMMDNKTGEIQYSFSPDELQTSLDSYCETKSDGGNYILESFELIESQQKGCNDEKEIKCSIIDTENERSSTTWLGSGFLETEESDGMTYFYINSEIMEGTFTFTSYSNDSTYLLQIKNGEVTFQTPNDSLLVTSPFNYVVACESRNCKTGSCTRVHNSKGWTCSPCQPDSNNGESFCRAIFLKEILSGIVIVLGSPILMY